MKETVNPEAIGPRGWKSWTPSEDRQLRKEAALEHSLDIIAARHQRTEGAILHRMERLDLKPNFGTNG